MNRASQPLQNHWFLKMRKDGLQKNKRNSKGRARHPIQNHMFLRFWEEARSWIAKKQKEVQGPRQAPPPKPLVF